MEKDAIAFHGKLRSSMLGLLDCAAVSALLEAARQEFCPLSQCLTVYSFRTLGQGVLTFQSPFLAGQPAVGGAGPELKKISSSWDP